MNKVLYTKVLIVGGGAAGMSAAIHLKTNKALLIEMPSSNSFFSPWNIMIRPENEFKKELIKAGNGMNNRKLLNKFIKSYKEIFNDLRALGISLKKSNIGFIPDYCFPGAEVKKIINRYTDKRGVKTIKVKVEKFLINKKGNIKGVIARTLDNSAVNIIFDYLILAGGGLSSFFDFTTGEKTVNGSILALCYENNLEITNIEFLMFHPFLITDKRFSRVLISGEILSKMIFKNEKGNEFLSTEIKIALKNNKHHSVFPQMVKEFYIQSLKGKIFAELDCSSSWFEQYKKENEFGFIFKKYKKNEIGKLEIHPAFHFSIGGLKINNKSQTSQSHIYAAGEITGGLHGSNRIGGTAVAEAWIFGKIAALEINKKIKSEKIKITDNSEKLEEKGNLGISKEIKTRIWEALGPVKYKKELQNFYSFLKRKKKLSSEEKLIQKIVEISLLRKESIGAFYCSDFPNAKKAKNSFLKGNKIFFK